MWGGDDAAQRGRDALRREERLEERRRKKSERRARRHAEQEQRRQEDAQLLGHLVEKMSERGTLAAVAAELPRPLNRGFGFSQKQQVSPSTEAGRVRDSSGSGPPPPERLKRPL